MATEVTLVRSAIQMRVTVNYTSTFCPMQIAAVCVFMFTRAYTLNYPLLIRTLLLLLQTKLPRLVTYKRKLRFTNNRAIKSTNVSSLFHLLRDWQRYMKLMFNLQFRRH